MRKAADRSASDASGSKPPASATKPPASATTSASGSTATVGSIVIVTPWVTGAWVIGATATLIGARVTAAAMASAWRPLRTRTTTMTMRRVMRITAIMRRRTTTTRRDSRSACTTTRLAIAQSVSALAQAAAPAAAGKRRAAELKPAVTPAEKDRGHYVPRLYDRNLAAARILVRPEPKVSTLKNSVSARSNVSRDDTPI